MFRICGGGEKSGKHGTISLNQDFFSKSSLNSEILSQFDEFNVDNDPLTKAEN